MKKIALILIIAFAALAFITWRNAPIGTRWLGDGIQNSSDIAVYFSYLQQGRDGHVLLSNLYAIEPHAHRFDAFWSSVGLIARSGISLILIHEIIRAVGIAFLVTVLWHVTNTNALPSSRVKSDGTEGSLRSIDTKGFLRSSQSLLGRNDSNKQERTLATLLCLGGIGTGWMYTVWLELHHAWTPGTYAAPDLVTEFALGPTLFGGAHGIFAVSLLILSLRTLWYGLQKMDRTQLLLGGLEGAVLFSFHPYSVPVVIVFCFFALLLHWPTVRIAFRTNLITIAGAGILMSIPCFYYVWLVMDPIFGRHHLADNILPIQQLPIWLVTLLPFFIATMWMWKKKKLPQKIEWTSLWLISAVLLTAILPVPWKRKLLEGLLVPLVFLTLPAWLAIATWVRRIQPRFIRSIIGGLLFYAAWFGPIQVYLSQLTLIQRPDFQQYFYRPEELFQTTDWISSHIPTTTVLLSDDRWTNIWLPALTGRRVWLGHNHETPRYAAKLQQYDSLFLFRDPKTVQTVLNDMGIDILLTTSPSSTENMAPLLQPNWIDVYHNQLITVWGRR